MIPPNPPVTCKSFARAKRSAFSLVEVVLAVGVISFAFVAILGLIPAGLAQFRQAMDNSVGTQIAQRITLECEQTDFYTLINLKNAPTNPQKTYFYQLASYSTSDSSKTSPLYVRYFDEQGNEVVPASTTLSATEQASVIYHVNTRIEYPIPLAELSSAGSDSTGSPAGLSSGGATVVVQVAFNPSGRTLKLYPNTPGNPLSDLIDMASSKLPAGTVKTYCAQIGRND